MVILTTPDVNVVTMDFPGRGNEMVVLNEDGSYTILINARLSYEGQLRAYEHAMRHIRENDFNKDNVQAIEARAHEIPASKNQKKNSSLNFDKRIANIRSKRISIQKKLQKREQEVEFVLKCDPERFYRNIEAQYLYGNDL